VAHFSNPNVTYNGFATGIDHNVDPNNSADAVRSLSQTAPTVADFRPSATTTPPTAPSSLSANAPSHDRVDLSWSDNAGDESGYRVERSTDGVNFSEIATLGANTTSYADTGVAASTPYDYRVRAYNGAGNSGYSNTASVTTPQPPPPPATPTGLNAAAASGTQIDVSWGDVANESGYRLERADSGSGPWSTVANLPADSTGYGDGGLDVGATYFYRLFAYNGSGDSDAAGPVSAQTLTFVDSFAQSASASQGSLSGSVSATRSDDGSTQSLTEGETGGKPANRTTRAQAVWQFDVPAGMSVTVLANAWVTGSTDEDAFDIEYSVGGSGYSPLFTVDNGNTLASYSAMLPTSASGAVTIRATDTNRDRGARSIETLHMDYLVIRTESDPTATAPNAPTGAQASPISHNLVTLSWTDNASDETGFRIERSVNGGAWSSLTTVATNVTSYDDTSVSGETSYAYRVAAYNGAGDSASAESNSVTTLPAPAGPTLQANGYKVKGRQSVDLSWTGATGAVDIYRDGGMVATAPSSGGAGAYTDAIDVKGGGTYQYEVCETGTSTCSNTATIVF
jgi:titin